MWSWLLRGIVLLALFAGWLFTIWAILGLLLPSVDGLGVACGFSLAGLLGFLTGGYWLLQLPMMVLPMNDEQRLHWLCYVVYGYLACVLATTLGLRGLGHVQFDDFTIQVSLRGVASLLSVLFLVAIGLGLYVPRRHDQRMLTVCLLFLGWIGAMVTLFVLADDVHESGNAKAMLVLSALFYLTVVLAGFLPSSAKVRRPTLAFGLLGWLFLVVGFVSFHIAGGRVRELGPYESEAFLALSAGLFAAPLFGWLGGPWIRHRVGWTVCAVTCAAVVWTALLTIPLAPHANIADYVRSSYDGPALFEPMGMPEWHP